MLQLRYISLFSGGFGLDLGAELAATPDISFHVAACVDIDPYARSTIRFNRPDVLVIGDREDEAGGDLNELSTSFILQRAGLQVGEVDLVIGGPPCQSWSILGKRRGFEDSNGEVMRQFVRFVKESRPRAFIMENVDGFLTFDDGTACQEIIAQFSDPVCLYIVHPWRLDAVDFGVPQYRKRAFLVGLCDEFLHAPLLTPPLPTHRALNLSARREREGVFGLAVADLGAELGLVAVAVFRRDVVLDSVFPHGPFLAGHEPGGLNHHALLAGLDLGPILAVHNLSRVRAKFLLLGHEHDVAVRHRLVVERDGARDLVFARTGRAATEGRRDEQAGRYGTEQE